MNCLIGLWPKDAMAEILQFDVEKSK